MKMRELYLTSHWVRGKSSCSFIDTISRVQTTNSFCSIQITTIKPDSKTHEGVLFAVDRKLNLVAINTALAPPNPSTPLISLPGDYHVILMRSILSFQLLSGPEESDPPAGNEPLPVITQQEMARLRDREQKAVQKLKDEERKRGKGVTAEIQELFNGIERMYVSPPTIVSLLPC